MPKPMQRTIDESWNKVRAYLESKGDHIDHYRKAEAANAAEFILLVLANSTNEFTIGSQKDWGDRTREEVQEHKERVDALRRQPEFADVINTWDTCFDCISLYTLVWIQPYGLFVRGELKVDRKKRETIFNKAILKREVENELELVLLGEMVGDNATQVVDALIEQISSEESKFIDYQEEILKLLKKASSRMHAIDDAFKTKR